MKAAFYGNLTWEEVAYGENCPLKTPIVAVTNTEETKGAHWVALVIIPEDKDIPEVLKTVLGEGIDELFPLSKKIRFLQSSDFKVKQQTDGNSCGYWAIYNVLCCIQTKNLDYLLEFSKEGKQDQANLFLRRVLHGNEDLSLLLEDLEEKDENNDDDKNDHRDPNKEEGKKKSC